MYKSIHFIIMKYTIHNQYFSTKEAIKIEAQKRIKRLRNMIINDTNHKDDFCFFRSLFERHHHAEHKIGPGIKCIHFRPNLKFPCSTSIYIERNDDTEIIISYKKCISKPTAFSELSAAMRAATEPFTREFREVCEYDTCTFCDSKYRLEVDHIDPFHGIRDEYLNTTTNVHPTKFNRDHNDFKTFREEDREFKDQWITFHNSKANYQLLCASCNRKKSGKLKYEPLTHEPPIQDGVCFFKIPK